MVKSLPHIRDLLLPGIRSLEQKLGRQLDIAVDFKHDSLILISTSSRTTLFTREDLDNERLKELPKRVAEALKWNQF